MEESQSGKRREAAGQIFTGGGKAVSAVRVAEGLHPLRWPASGVVTDHRIDAAHVRLLRTHRVTDAQLEPESADREAAAAISACAAGGGAAAPMG